MGASDDGLTRYPGVDGTVTVCFNQDGPLGANTATVNMSVKGLGKNTASALHVHEGTHCGNQGGHYFNSANTGGPNTEIGQKGDPWYIIASKLAPTGAGYTTDEHGAGHAFFLVNDGFGYQKHVGKVVVIHDTVGSQLGVDLGLGGDYVPVACGVLMALPQDG
jgi:hypothetical protein